MPGQSQNERLAPRPGAEELGRLADRLALLRAALLDLVEGEAPGSREVLIQRPAIEAEIWSLEAQLASLEGAWKQAEACGREAARCQGEARRATVFETAQRVEVLERQLGLRSKLAGRLQSLK